MDGRISRCHPRPVRCHALQRGEPAWHWLVGEDRDNRRGGSRSLARRGPGRIWRRRGRLPPAPAAGAHVPDSTLARDRGRHLRLAGADAHTPQPSLGAPGLDRAGDPGPAARGRAGAGRPRVTAPGAGPGHGGPATLRAEPDGVAAGRRGPHLREGGGGREGGGRAAADAGAELEPG